MGGDGGGGGGVSGRGRDNNLHTSRVRYLHKTPPAIHLSNLRFCDKSQKVKVLP